MANMIDLNEDDAKDFAWGELEGFTPVLEECDRDSAYKDSAPSFTVCKRESDGTFWAMNWSRHIAHYSDGDHQYDDKITQGTLEKVERIVIDNVWKEIE